MSEKVIIGMHASLADLTCVLKVDKADVLQAAQCISDGWKKWNTFWEEDKEGDFEEVQDDEVPEGELIGDGYNDFVYGFLKENQIEYEDLCDAYENGNLKEEDITWLIY